MNGSLKNGSTNGSHRNGSSKNGSATHHEEKLLLSRKRVAEAIAEQPWPKKPRILEKTDVSRWRLNDEDGRHRWVYVEDNQALKDWPQSYAEKYYLGLPLGLPDLPPPESPLDAATNGLTFFEKLQLDPGEWGCECGGPMFLLPGIVITWYVTKTPISTFHATEIKNYLFARADPELGGWGLHTEGESTAFGCTLSYTALRLLGVDAEDPIMVKARARLHQLGGATSSPHWAKWWLAVLGVASWDLVNPVPPELWLVPDWVPIAPWRWWIHIRQVYLPMSYIYSRRWSCEETDVTRQLKNELFVQQHASINWKAHRNDIATTDNYHPKTWSMHRVVFGAFMMDIIHATMFGHLADMAPDEIRLPLPCDDSLWAAPNPDSFRSVDSTWRMYGIKQISFLEGLKSALHCNPVKTHSFGRMIIMCGLLSVGWHLSHRDSQIKWLDRPTRTSEHDTWRRTILKAFDIWKESYDADIGLSETNLGESHGSANGPVQSPSVLYHFAHIALQVDIVTCQVFAGAKRLVNRKISTRDYSNAVARMRIWSSKASTRHAVLHAFKLLHRVLVGGARRGSGYPPLQDAWYSCRNEADPHRPWSLYYAALGIWSLVRALNGGQALPPYSGPYLSTATYLTRIANLSELTEETARGLGDGLPDLLRLLQASFEDAHAELLHEAAERLKTCRELMAGAGT
ncbi:hypothetical protein BN1723_005950, partial [Verticillium longisporum]